MRCVLEMLAVLTLVPSVRPLLADTVEVLDEAGTPVFTVGQWHCLILWPLPSHAPLILSDYVCVCVCVCAGMSIVLGMAEGEVFPADGDIQKAALQVSLLCSPTLASRWCLRWR